MDEVRASLKDIRDISGEILRLIDNLELNQEKLNYLRNFLGEIEDNLEDIQEDIREIEFSNY